MEWKKSQGWECNAPLSGTGGQVCGWRRLRPTSTFRSDFISQERILPVSFSVSSKLLWKTVNMSEQGGLYIRKMSLKCFFYDVKKALLHTNILFLSILILYFGIRNVSIFSFWRLNFTYILRARRRCVTNLWLGRNGSLFLCCPLSLGCG